MYDMCMAGSRVVTCSSRRRGGARPLADGRTRLHGFAECVHCAHARPRRGGGRAMPSTRGTTPPRRLPPPAFASAKLRLPPRQATGFPHLFCSFAAAAGPRRAAPLGCGCTQRTGPGRCWRLGAAGRPAGLGARAQAFVTPVHPYPAGRACMHAHRVWSLRLRLPPVAAGRSCCFCCCACRCATRWLLLGVFRTLLRGRPPSTRF